MASLKDLQRQISSIKNISKVTDALQAVSAAKFRKAEARVKRARPYAENLEEMMRSIAAKSTSKDAMLVGREVRNVAVVSLTADRGLCGGFNSQIVRRTTQFRREQEHDVLQVASGRKGIGVFRFRGIELAETYEGFTDSPTYEDSRRIGARLTELFQEEEADAVYLIYNRFQNAVIQRPVLVRLLPIAPEGEEEEDQRAEEEKGFGSEAPFEYIPGPDEILGDLIPRYVQTMIWQALLESAAGEHGARMTTMKNATDNANELVDSLTLQKNKARQAQITQEILEIVSGAEALSSN